MYPPSRDAALLQQLETERAITELVELALEIWLPLAEKSVLHAAAPPPDPGAAAEQDAQWDYLIEAIVLFGIGIIAADTIAKAYRAITGAPMAAVEPLLAATPVNMPGLPSRSELRNRTAAVLRRRLRIDTEATEAALNATPVMRSFVAEHIGNIRGRVMDAVGRVFRRVRTITEEAPADEARADVSDALEPAAEEWQDAADRVGQTQATGVLNGATVAAAQAATAAFGTQLVQEWVAILDTHTRIAHAEANGQRVPFGQSFDVDNEPLRFPGDPLGSIDNTANCRCRTFAFLAPLQASISHGSGTMADETKEQTMGQFRSFTSVLAVIGKETDDGRMFASDMALAFRDFPLPLTWQKQSASSHSSAFTVGVIESAGVVGTEVIGEGYMLDTPEAAEAMKEIEHGVTGPSVDMGDVTWELRDATGNVVTDDEWWDDPDMHIVQTMLSGKVLGATLVSIPAFGQTTITLGAMVERGQEALVAAAALAPIVRDVSYPAEFFTDPGFDEPTFPHITAAGRIQGHLAAFNVCHIGIQKDCVKAPKSQTDYAWFHTSPPVKTSDGGNAKVGRLTVGSGHAADKLGVGPAIDHYDNVGTCFALVHVGEDEHGIWFSGVAAPGATADQVTAGLAAPLSGDWRWVAGNYELVAALAVNTPGFPILASGATDESGTPLSLVASLGPCQYAEESGPGINLKDFAREVVAALKQEERRDSETQELLAQVRRAEALALIAKVGQ